MRSSMIPLELGKVEIGEERPPARHRRAGGWFTGLVSMYQFSAGNTAACFQKPKSNNFFQKPLILVP